MEDAPGLSKERAVSGRDRRPREHLLTLSDLDQRTRAYKQAVSLKSGFLSDLGGEDRASVAQQELAQRGAVLGAMLEDQEVKWLAGAPIELDRYCALVNAQRRVMNDIGLERRPRDVTPSIDSYLTKDRE